MARIKQAWDYGPWAYNIDAARQILDAAPRPAVEIDLAPLADLVVDGGVHVDPAHLHAVDPYEPLIAIGNPGGRPPAPEQAPILPVDGWHRVARLHLLGLDTAFAYVLTSTEADSIRIYVAGLHEPHGQTATKRKRSMSYPPVG